MPRLDSAILVALLCGAAACTGQIGDRTDVGRDASAPATRDGAASSPDASAAPDAGSVTDAGARLDAGESADAAVDGGASDAGEPADATADAGGGSDAGGGVDAGPVNQAPQAEAGPDITVQLPSSAALTGRVTDDGLPNGTLTAQWTVERGPAPAAFADDRAATTSVTFTQPGDYLLRLTVSDGALDAADTATVTVQAAPPVNQAPTVSVGPAQTITLPAAAALTGVVTDDGLPAGGALTLAWTRVSGPGNVAFADATRANTAATFSTDGVYVLRLTASDGALAASADLTVTVQPPPNAPPTVSAGGPQTVVLPNAVTLNGAASDDGRPAGGGLTVAWSRVSGPGPVAFGSPNQVATTATFTTAGPYVLRLTASDGALSAASDVAVTVQVAPPVNQAPTVSAGPNLSVTLPAQANLQGSASDDGLPNGSTLALTWARVSGPGAVTFGDPSAAVTSAAFAAPGTYRLRLTASDGARSAFSEATVTVQPPPNQPPTVSAGANQTVPFGGTANLGGSASDDGLPAGSTLTTTWSRVSGPGTVTFANASAPSTTATFSTDGTYVLRLTASDGARSASSELTVVVQPPPNQPPTVGAGPNQTVTLPSGVNLAGTASDDGLPNGSSLTTLWSRVSGPGVVTFGDASQRATTATFSRDGTYVLRLTASDGSLSAFSEVTIVVNPVPNQPPTVNAGANQTVTLPATAALNPVVSDDGLPSGLLITTWSRRSGPGTVTFGNPAFLITNASFSAPGTYVLRLTVDDGALTAFSELTVTVNPAPPVNQPPTVDAGPNQTVTLPSGVNLAGAASDDGLPNGSSLTTLWTTVTGPGLVTFGDASQPATTATFGAPGTYVLRLSATDGALTAQSDVTVTVNPAPPVNQPPTVSAGANQTMTLPATAALNPVVSDDGLPSGLLISTWSRRSGPGTVTFGNPAFLITDASFSAPGTYVLRLTVDDGALTAFSELTVTVNPAPPVNQPPTVDSGPNQTVTLPSGVNLAGAASDDGLPNGSSLTTLWTTVTGPGLVTFGDASQPATTATFGAPGTYVLRLSATDGALTAQSDITITVNAAPPPGPTGRILMFVAYNDVWWSEYKVAYEALRAAGYTVEVRSSRAGFAITSYSTAIDQTPPATGLDPTYPVPVSYAQFTAQFQQLFGAPWNAAWNPTANIPLDGRIQDVPSMAAYDALIIPGGRGGVAYRLDGTYAALSPQAAPGTHVTTQAEVQAAALQLNLLIGQALAAGKPVAGECHGAPIVPFARIPGSTGGYLGLGRSVLEGRVASGYPFFDGDTPARFSDLGVTLAAPEKVVVDGPEFPDFGGAGRDRIVTSTDWYPETAAYLTRTFLNMLETYPAPSAITGPVQVLVFGGDEPTNYPPTQPARYTDLVTLLNDAGDEHGIVATGTNDPNTITPATLANYDVLLYFRHDAIPQAAQVAIRNWVDAGGGLVGLHHAIYNQANAKGTLLSVFGGELPAGAMLNNELGLVYSGEVNTMIDVNLGHFVSTYNVHLTPGQPTSSLHYASTNALPNPNQDNDPLRGYWAFTIPASDELYLGTTFGSGVTFGRGIGQIERLFSNDRWLVGSPNPNNGQYDTAGWVRRYDPTGDGSVGRVVYLQPGETTTRTLAHPAYRQVVKNAVLWAADG